MKKDKKNIVVVYVSGASRASGYKVAVNKKSIYPPTDINFFNDIDSISPKFLRNNYPALYAYTGSGLQTCKYL